MDDSVQPTTGVSRTAVIIAQARAREHTRPDRLFADPLAAPLVEAVGWIPVQNAGHLNEGHFVLRTRFFDDHLLRVVSEGTSQVVLLAAGLDTRAFRLNWPKGTHLFEVDLPGLVAFKEAVLGVRRAVPRCDRTTVTADLRHDWADRLVAAGFDPSRPTAWLVEGLLMYLDEDGNDKLLTGIGELSAPGSTLALEHVNRAYVELPEMRAVHERLRRFGAGWASTLEDPVRRLTAHGWLASVTPQTRLAAEHGRPVPRLTDPAVVGAARMWLATAVRAG
ncbi:SAM-dependent methyltransferase [Streptomyces alkaliterrae]|uniref:S-adenosyl-L-methionine-dependent methyltransferase n=1 Tax=Streptomyces alkaliterrae TaxID=2213162 RepID=A0A5P0YMX3_9ACTN|nr:SAM-dependent methyltransferase [Streptomyces alkaliterrae]MBB1259182.1 SAM-dependent methyltransferase [Streptomyces alkaliterrae]MQS01588.1 SAM-dependent methyltransferase [Streptomyces alkaliterrae]